MALGAGSVQPLAVRIEERRWRRLARRSREVALSLSAVTAVTGGAWAPPRSCTASLLSVEFGTDTSG